MMLSESTVKVCTSPFIRKTFLILSSYLASAHTDCLNLFLKNLLLRFAVSEVHYKLNFLPVNNVFKNSFVYLILYKNCSKFAFFLFYKPLKPLCCLTFNHFATNMSDTSYL